MLNGAFAVEEREFVTAGAVMAVGFTALYRQALSGNQISRREGIMLAVVYVAFTLLQLGTLIPVDAAP